MPIHIDVETYFTAVEAASYLGVSRPTFYKNVRPHISEYEYGAFKRRYYRKSEIDHYKEMRHLPSSDDTTH